MKKIPILIVDDDPLWILMLKKQIASAYPPDIFNLIFYVAGNGADALQLYEELSKVGPKPDIILCDTNMPFIDGIHFWRALKALTDSTPPFVLFFSGWHSNPAITKKHILQSGIQYVMTKTEAEKELIPLIQKFV